MFPAACGSWSKIGNGQNVSWMWWEVLAPAGRLRCAGETPMKLVVALIRPFKLEEVKHALSSIGLTGMVVTEARGFGHHKGHTEVYRGSEYTVDFQPLVRIEVAILDEQKDSVVATIVKAARTGKPGDGRVFVQPIDDVTRIDTDQRGHAAL